MRILIVEDEIAARVLFRSIFSVSATRMDEAHTLRECLDLVGRRVYDIIVLDLQLPDSEPMSTVAAIPTIKKKQSHKPVIVVSAHSGDGLKRATREKGADFFIEKSNPDNMRTGILSAIAVITKAVSSGPNLQESVTLLKKISGNT